MTMNKVRTIKYSQLCRGAAAGWLRVKVLFEQIGLLGEMDIM